MHRLEHLSTIIADLGDIFTFIAPLTALPLIVAVIFSEWNMLLPMAAVPVTFLILWVCCYEVFPAVTGE